MKYDDFLRVYYRVLIEITKNLIWSPQNVFNLELEPIDQKYFEEGDAGFFGDSILKLDAPNNIYETFFEDYAHKYPDYGYILLNSQELRKASEMFRSKEDIEKMLNFFVYIYTKANLFKEIEVNE